MGEPSIFAVESALTTAYEDIGLLALGSFAIHVNGQTYGVQKPDATFLACSVDAVKKRIANRGSHIAEFSREPEAQNIADAYLGAFYSERPKNRYLHMSRPEFARSIRSGRITWAPDGDAAFDDGSFVLQFDVEARVRLIAFKNLNGRPKPSTLSDRWLPADDYYQLLNRWVEDLESTWSAMPKVSKKSDH